MEALKYLWAIVFTLGMVGILGGLFVLLLDRMAAVNGLSTNSILVIGNVSAGLSSIFSDWYGIIIVVCIIVILLLLLVGVIRLFGGGMGTR